MWAAYGQYEDEVLEYVHLSLQRIRWLGEHGDVVKPSNKKQRGSGSNASRGKPSTSPNGAGAAGGKNHTHQPAFKRSACPTTVLACVESPPTPMSLSWDMCYGGRRVRGFSSSIDAAGAFLEIESQTFCHHRYDATRALE